MDKLKELQAIQDAYKLIHTATNELAHGVNSIYAITLHAEKHLSDRAAELLREEVVAA